MLNRLRDQGFDVLTRNHSDAILSFDFPDELAEIVTALSAFRISMAELIGGGGGESGQTQRLRRALDAARWRKHNFHVQTIVDGVERDGISHEVDHVRFTGKGALALEVEWNNKDPFFDRDLENFQRLHALSAISVGLIVTRGASMQEGFRGRITDWLRANDLHSEGDLERLGIGDRTQRQKDRVAGQVARGVAFHEAFATAFVQDKFGPSTTHWAKLEDRVARGVGNPCPLLLIGLPMAILSDAPTQEQGPARLI
ncbi:BglII/BstYI family type II restriction endonuclease [Pseudooceanicola sp.]|uniref:BglII/BstYI family type II restriction endonuclease n=1 Tax=Pseudooceanicola sp. TaxID=1914328 RepID=UPI00262863FA|nr:BglII/BstYI family type II restriction endonuclease [Pseudooceanicola sp.]MDF1856853.1 BglII/BstYI family type II restriction endonuclease [Pseudooceanicola sp.]